MTEFYRVHLPINFVVPVDDGTDRDTVRREALLELRLLAQDGWFTPDDIEIIEQIHTIEDGD